MVCVWVYVYKVIEKEHKWQLLNHICDIKFRTPSTYLLVLHIMSNVVLFSHLLVPVLCVIDLQL